MSRYIDADKLVSKLIDIQKECEKRPFANIAEAFNKVVDALCTCLVEQKEEDRKQEKLQDDDIPADIPMEYFENGGI